MIGSSVVLVAAWKKSTCDSYSVSFYAGRRWTFEFEYIVFHPSRYWASLDRAGVNLNDRIVGFVSSSIEKLVQT